MSIQINPINLGNYIVPEDARGGLCIDVGCNVGSFMQKYSAFFREIHFYEPITECFNLCMNFAKKHKHIFGYNKAVWSQSNTILNILIHENNDSGSSAIESHALNEEWKKDNILQTVESVSLSDVIKNFNEVDYFKCDCENSEYFIFMNQDLQKIKYIGMELHWQMGKNKQEKLLNHIFKTHDLMYGNAGFTNYNKEILLKRK